MTLLCETAPHAARTATHSCSMAPARGCCAQSFTHAIAGRRYGAYETRREKRRSIPWALCPAYLCVGNGPDRFTDNDAPRCSVQQVTLFDPRRCGGRRCSPENGTLFHPPHLLRSTRSAIFFVPACAYTFARNAPMLKRSPPEFFLVCSARV